KAKQRQQSRAETIVRLEINKVSFAGKAEQAGIDAAEINDRLAGRGEAIRPMQSYLGPNEIWPKSERIEWNSGRRRILRLLAQPCGSIAKKIVPVRSSLVLCLDGNE